MGFALAPIAEILNHYNDPRTLANFLTVKRAEVEAEAYETKKRLLLLETAIERLRKDDKSMNYDISFRTMPERYVASVRQTVPSYEQEYILWQTMMQETTPLKMQPADNCLSVAVFHDEGYKESDVDIEIQACVKGRYENTEHVVFKTVAPIFYSFCLYTKTIARSDVGGGEGGTHLLQFFDRRIGGLDRHSKRLRFAILT